MSIKTFIDRPITSVMMAVTIVILGVASLLALPLSQYPDIAPPTVKVSATYTGASAETVISRHPVRPSGQFRPLGLAGCGQ